MVCKKPFPAELAACNMLNLFSALRLKQLLKVQFDQQKRVFAVICITDLTVE
jgi:hypothetical protein